MFAISDILRFNGEKGIRKIVRPVWDVITDYLVLVLPVLSILIAGMEVTSGKFECLPAVVCPGISRSNMSFSLSQIKYPNNCKAFYNSQKTSTVREKTVVTDTDSVLQYVNFVNSECSKKAIPKFLSYLWMILFVQAFSLIIVDKLWLELPTTASVIENFAVLVMECYASSCPNFELTKAITRPLGVDNQRHSDNVEMGNPISGKNGEQLNILDDAATVSSVKTLHEKLQTFKENIAKSSQKHVNIRHLYLAKAVFGAILAFIFIGINSYHAKHIQDEMNCTITQHIPVPHDHFSCSYKLANAFAVVLYVYIAVLVVILLTFGYITFWTVSVLTKKKCKYDFENENLPQMVGTKLSDIDPVSEDFGFILHLLHYHNKTYVVRFAHFLSKYNRKKDIADDLKREHSVSKLQRQLKENGNKLTFTNLPQVPQTIFELSSKIITLELIECGPLNNEDFKWFYQLTSLKNLYIINCGLTCIPNAIFEMEWLELLNLKGNCISLIDQNISKLINLTYLDLSDNGLKVIDPEFQKLCNLFAVYLSGNPELEMSALEVIQACQRICVWDPPQHLSGRYELNKLERSNNTNQAVKENVVFPYTPMDAHIDLEDHMKIYKMDMYPKGIAIIFNNFSYAKSTSYNDRRGSEKDVSMLTLLFKEIGFHIACCINYTAEQAKTILEDHAKDTEYIECGCIAVVIMSHGTEEGIVFSDGKVVPVLELVECVQKSPLYEGKPKLFFLQACRSFKNARGSENSAVHEPVYSITGNSKFTFHDVNSDSFPLGTQTRKDMSQACEIARTAPNGSDVLLSYSTFQGLAFRNTELGSWYVRALVNVFSKHAWKEDIQSLLTMVNCEVVHGYTLAGNKQVPAVLHTLGKRLYLLPGYPSQLKQIKPLQHTTHL